MKEGNLFVSFCTYEIHRTGVLQIAFLVSLDSLDKEGFMGLVPRHLDLWCKSSWILNDFSLKIKLNHSWKFQRNWNVPLVLLERSWWPGFDGIYLVIFGFHMWEILILKWFQMLKIQINSKNQVLKGKISWECGITWRLTIQFKHDFLLYLAVQKINTYLAKQFSHVEFPIL